MGSAWMALVVVAWVACVVVAAAHAADCVSDPTPTVLCDGADLRGRDLKNAHLPDASFAGANLEGAVLRGAFLAGARFDGANMRRADLSGAVAPAASLRFVDLSLGDVSAALLDHADLTGANLSGADLSACRLHRAERAGADLSGAVTSGTLWNAHLPRASSETHAGSPEGVGAVVWTVLSGVVALGLASAGLLVGRRTPILTAEPPAAAAAKPLPAAPKDEAIPAVETSEEAEEEEDEPPSLAELGERLQQGGLTPMRKVLQVLSPGKLNRLSFMAKTIALQKSPPERIAVQGKASPFSPWRGRGQEDDGSDVSSTFAVGGGRLTPSPDITPTTVLRSSEEVAPAAKEGAGFGGRRPVARRRSIPVEHITSRIYR